MSEVCEPVEPVAVEKEIKDDTNVTKGEDVDEELMAELADKDLSFYSNMKDLPDAVVKKYLPDMKRRWEVAEKRVPEIEQLMIALNPPDKSLEEDRFEIMGELLDKACQGFEIFDEHETRRIPVGHRLVLESRLLAMITEKFDIICKIVKEFHLLKDDRPGANREREWLRYEIRMCDLHFTEIHERFLKSYLDMEW